jgi:hypothetical protein
MTSLSKVLDFNVRDALDNLTADMFGSKALARRTDPETSHEAASKVNTTKLEEIVLNTIRDSGVYGCTADEVVAANSGYKGNSLTPRFAPLIKRGLIYDSGLRRKTASGSTQRVLVAAEYKGVICLPTS